MLLMAARSHAGFRAWRGSLTVLAVAAFSRQAMDAFGAFDSSQWQQHLAQQHCPGVQRPVQRVQLAQTLQLGVPLVWVQREVAGLEQLTSRLRAAPASRQEVEELQQRLFSVCEGEATVYRGYRWGPRLVLFLELVADFGAASVSAVARS